MPRLDSHQHFWRYHPAAYAWITDDKKVLQRDFLPADLQREMAASGVSGTIAVQASHTLEETRWLLELASEHPWIEGVVGWAPLVDADVEGTLEELAADDRLVGIRHILHDEPDPHYMLRADFNRGVDTLKNWDLPYDILIFERHLPQTIEFVDRHEEQVFIADHLAKPRVKADELSPWRENLLELGKRPHVYAKLSGLVTEADWSSWSAVQFNPYFDTLLEAFGPERILFGSDWPVCLLATEYKQWLEIVDRYVSKLSPSEGERIWAGSARQAYRLPATPAVLA